MKIRNLIPSYFFLLIFISSLLSPGFFNPDFTFSRYDFENGNPKQLELSKELNEISGIAFSESGGLYAHNDEKGIIYKLDPSSGKIIKKFYIGNNLIKEDFEDIAIIKNKFYLITSAGKIYEFEEAANDGKAEYKAYDTGVTDAVEIEGLCYDEASNSLLFAGKTSPAKLKDYRFVFSFSLEKKESAKEPRFQISLKELKEKFGIKVLYPSAIGFNASANTFYILNGKGKPAIIELDSKGKVLNAANLNPKANVQPEGIAFSASGSVYISNEAAGKKPFINIYKMK